MAIFYSTKYALTKGIQEIDGTPTGKDGIYYTKLGYYEYLHGEGKQWHRTIDAATECAEKMRLAKIAELERSIAKLKKKSFSGAGKDGLFAVAGSERQ